VSPSTNQERGIMSTNYDMPKFDLGIISNDLRASIEHLTADLMRLRPSTDRSAALEDLRVLEGISATVEFHAYMDRLHVLDEAINAGYPKPEPVTPPSKKGKRPPRPRKANAVSHEESWAMACPECGVDRGEPCVTLRDGKSMSYMHSARAGGNRARKNVPPNTARPMPMPSPVEATTSVSWEVF